MSAGLCLIGRIVRAHGVKGGVVVESFSDHAERFSMLEDILLCRGGDVISRLYIERVQRLNERDILFLRGHDTRTSIESIIGCDICIPEEDMLPPPEGKRYIHDLIGSRVLTTAGEDRGIVRDVWLMPASDMYVVDWNGREILIPSVPDFIAEVNTQDKCIRVHLVPGLFEESDED